MKIEYGIPKEDGRVPSAPGSREPSPDGLGPSGFDPSREPLTISQLLALDDPLLVALDACMSAFNGFENWRWQQFRLIPEAEVITLERVAERIAFAQRVVLAALASRDSDGSPKGGDSETGSVRSTTARAVGIAQKEGK